MGFDPNKPLDDETPKPVAPATGSVGATSKQAFDPSAPLDDETPAPEKKSPQGSGVLLSSQLTRQAQQQSGLPLSASGLNVGASAFPSATETILNPIFGATAAAAAAADKTNVPISVMDQLAKQYGWSADITTQSADVTTQAMLMQNPEYALQQQEVDRQNQAMQQRFGRDYAMLDSYYKYRTFEEKMAEQNAAQKPEPVSLGAVPEDPNKVFPAAKSFPIDQARQAYRFYLKNYEPDKLAEHDMKVREFEERQGGVMTASDDADVLVLEKQKAQFDVEAIRYYGMGANSEVFDNAKAITVDYSADFKEWTASVEAINAAAETVKTIDAELQVWPRDQNTNPLFLNAVAETRYNSLIEKRAKAVADDTQARAKINTIAASNPDFVRRIEMLNESQQRVEGITNEAKTYLSRYPLFEQKVLQAQAAEALASVDATMVPGIPGAAATQLNVSNPALRAIVEFSTSLSYLPKAVEGIFTDSEDYYWTDYFYDVQSARAQTFSAAWLPVAGDYVEGPDGNRYFEQATIPKIVNTTTHLALMIGAGVATSGALSSVGVSARLAGTLGQVASGSALMMNDFYMAGKDAGMSEGEAENYALVSGLVAGSIYAVNPYGMAANTITTVGKRTAQQYIQALATGATRKMALQQSAKMIGIEMANLSAVNVAAKLAEYGINTMANEISGVNLNTGQTIAQDMKHAVVMGVILGGAFGTAKAARTTKSRIENEAMFSAATNSKDYKVAIEKMLSEGQLTPEQSKLLMQRIDDGALAVASMPEGVSLDAKMSALPMLMDKIALTRKMRNADPVFKEQYERDIADLDARIREETGVARPEERDQQTEQNREQFTYQQLLMAEQAKVPLERAEVAELTRLREKYAPRQQEQATPEPVARPEAEVAPEVEPAQVRQTPEQVTQATEARILEDIQAMQDMPTSALASRRNITRRRIEKALEDGVIDKAKADELTTQMGQAFDARVADLKSTVAGRIDAVTNDILTFLKEKKIISEKSSGMVQNNMLDLESLITYTSSLIKRASAAGTDINIAVRNIIDAVKNHPAYQNAVKSGTMSEEAFQRDVFEKYQQAVSMAEATAGQVEMSPDGAPKTRVRAILDRVMKGDAFSPEFKAGIAERGIEYVPKSEKFQQAEARAYVEFFAAHNEIEMLTNSVFDLRSGMKADTRGAIIVELIAHYNDQARVAEAMPMVDSPAGLVRSEQAVALSSQSLAKAVELTTFLAEQVTTNARMAAYAGKAMKMMASTEQTAIAMLDSNARKKADDILDMIKRKFPKLSEDGKRNILARNARGIDAEALLADPRMFDLYWEAVYREEFSTEKQDYVKKQVEVMNRMDKAQADVQAIINEGRAKLAEMAADGTSTPEQIQAMRDQIITNVDRSYKDNYVPAVIEAQQANENISKVFRARRDIWITMSTLMQMNLLTAQSQLKNVLGYGPAVMLRTSAGAGASMLDYVYVKAMKAFAGKDLGRSVNVFQEAVGGIRYGAAYGFREGWSRIVRGTISDDLAKYNTKQSLNFIDAWRDLTAKRSGSEIRFYENKMAAALEATVGINADYMSRLLSMGDLPPRRIAEKGRLYEIAKQRDLKDLDMIEFMLFPDEAAAADAVEFGKKATWQNQTWLSDFIDSASEGLYKTIEEKLGNVNPEFGRHVAGVIRLAKTSVIPYTRTPINIVVEGISYSNPIFGLAQTGYYTSLSAKAQKAGNAAAAARYRGEAFRSFNKAIIASTISYVAYQLYSNGAITASFDKTDSPKERKAEMVERGANMINRSAIHRLMTGDQNWNQPRPGDIWSSYRGLGAASAALGSWVDTYKYQGINPDASFGMGDIFAMSGMQTLTNFRYSVEESFLKGTFSLLEAMKDGDDKMRNFAANTLIAMTSVAVPNTVAQVSKVTDPFIRETKEGPNTTTTALFINKFKANTFQGDDLPSKVSLWGDKITFVPKESNAAVYYFFGQLSPKAMTEDPVAYEVFSLYMKANDGSVLPSLPQQEISLPDKQRVLLTPKEYEEYQIMVGKQRKSLVNTLIQTDQYKNADDANKRVMLQKVYKTGMEEGRRVYVMNNERLVKMMGEAPAPKSGRRKTGTGPSSGNRQKKKLPQKKRF